MALLPLVEMGTAPPIVPGYDTLQPVIRFSMAMAMAGTMAVI